MYWCGAGDAEGVSPPQESRHGKAPRIYFVYSLRIIRRMKMLTESGKALPVPFTLGLIAGIVDTLGASGGTPSLLDWMIKEIFPRYHDHLPPIDERATYNPLYSYYRSHYGTLAPVDYAYLALLRRGLDVLHGIQAGSGIARRIGHHWWLGEPPIHQYRPLTDTLQYLLTPTILDNIHDARIAYISRIRPLEPGKPTIRLPSEEPFMLTAACQAFAEVFTKQSTIECQVESIEDTICILFPSCPFCNNQLATCSVLGGVVEEMIVWLYRKDTLDSVNKVLRDYSLNITPRNNDSHHVLITLTRKAGKHRN